MSQIDKLKNLLVELKGKIEQSPTEEQSDKYSQYYDALDALTKGYEIDFRPWGHYEVLLNEPFTKVKKITVKPRGRLSYQYHDQRTEDWIVIRGTAKITLDDEEVWRTEGERIRIKVGQKHRVQNPSFDNKLEFIEVQTGTYFGEDDIVRVDDDYGRLELDHLKDHVTMKEEQVKNKTDWWSKMGKEWTEEDDGHMLDNDEVWQ